MRWFLALSSVLLLALTPACGGEVTGGPDDDGTRQTSVVNGKQTGGFPSVVWLDSGCTGVLVGSRTVLTAAHCIHDGRTRGVYIGGYHYPAAYLVPHQRYQHQQPFYYDIGLVLLHHRAHVGASPVATSPPPVGSSLYLVGFGETSYNRGDSAKRWGYNIVGWVSGSTITYKHLPSTGYGNICYGDSGGPSFDQQGRVIGIHNFWDGYLANNPCWYGHGRDTRVDAFRGWIWQYQGWWEGW